MTCTLYKKQNIYIYINNDDDKFHSKLLISYLTCFSKS